MDYSKILRDVLKLEAEALTIASENLTNEKAKQLVSIFDYLMRVNGNLIFCGVGKSGYVGAKLASTFTSLGLKSFFLHPVEALHGDLGRIGENDAIVFLSKSGTTEEIIKLLPYVQIEKNMRIGLLGYTNSVLSEEIGVVLDCSVQREACLNNQAPTASTTVAMAMGDAMAVLYEHLVGLSREGFAANHPGGLLGKSLRIKVKDLMWKIDDCPIIEGGGALRDAILEMTRVPVGGLAVLDNEKNLLGILVEGDIRRTLSIDGQGLDTQIVDIMNSKPVSIGPEDLAFDALKLMEMRENQIALLPVVRERKFLGLIRLHDLLKEGFPVKK